MIKKTLTLRSAVYLVLCALAIACDTPVAMGPVYSTDFMLQLWAQRGDASHLSDRMALYDMERRANGIYASQERLDNGKPAHWVQLVDMGTISSLSLKSGYLYYVQQLQQELDSLSTGVPVEDLYSPGTAYQLDSCTFTVFGLYDGYYQVIVTKRKDE